MKKVVFLFMLTIFLAGVNSAFAQANFSTARRDGSSTWIETDTFGLAEKPWLHISVPGSDLTESWTFSFWNYPAPGSSSFLSNPLSGYKELVKDGLSDLYLAFNDVTWAGIVKPGDWNISATSVLFQSSGEPYFWTTVTAYNGNPSFKVTPEPVSCALFVLGGGVLAVGRRFRRRA